MFVSFLTKDRKSVDPDVSRSGEETQIVWGNNNQNISIRKSIFNKRKEFKCDGISKCPSHNSFFFCITKKNGLNTCSYSLLINIFYILFFLLKMTLKKAMHKIPHGWNNKHSP